MHFHYFLIDDIQHTAFTGWFTDKSSVGGGGGGEGSITRKLTKYFWCTFLAVSSHVFAHVPPFINHDTLYEEDQPVKDSAYLIMYTVIVVHNKIVKYMYMYIQIVRIHSKVEFLCLDDRNWKFY